MINSLFKMTKITNIFLIILSSAILTLLPGCQHNFHSGSLIPNHNLENLANSSLSKSQVQELLGSPDIIPTYSPDTWYFIYRNMTKRAFFQAKVIEQKIVKISFNSDVLASINIIDNSHNSDINIVSEFIRSQGSIKNPIHEYISNIGKFHKNNNKNHRR